MSFLYKNTLENMYEADVGKIVKIKDTNSKLNNKCVYIEGNTDEGYCYKDYNNFKNNPDEVCYIAECEFDNLLLVHDVNLKKEELIKKGGISTTNSIKDEVKNELIFSDYYYEYQKKGDTYRINAKDFDEEIIVKIAEYVFDNLKWQTSQTFIIETDWSGDIKEYYNKKMKKEDLEL